MIGLLRITPFANFADAGRKFAKGRKNQAKQAVSGRVLNRFLSFSFSTPFSLLNLFLLLFLLLLFLLLQGWDGSYVHDDVRYLQRRNWECYEGIVVICCYYYCYVGLLTPPLPPSQVITSSLPSTTVFFCQHGKDRTGLIAAMILGCCYVDKEVSCCYWWWQRGID